MQSNDSSQDGVIRSIDILLAARGKTRKWLAEELGKDQFWIGHRMNNRTMFKFPEIIAVAGVFGMKIEDFLAVPEVIEALQKQAVSA